MIFLFPLPHTTSGINDIDITKCALLSFSCSDHDFIEEQEPKEDVLKNLAATSSKELNAMLAKQNTVSIVRPNVLAMLNCHWKHKKNSEKKEKKKGFKCILRV